MIILLEWKEIFFISVISLITFIFLNPLLTVFVWIIYIFYKACQFSDKQRRGKRPAAFCQKYEDNVQ